MDPGRARQGTEAAHGRNAAEVPKLRMQLVGVGWLGALAMLEGARRLRIRHDQTPWGSMNRRQYEAARRLSRDLGATAEERDTARRRCEEYEAKQTQGAIVKWWRLRLCVKDGPRANKWLGNTTEFRAVLRYIKGTQAASSMNGCYRLDADSARAIDNGRVDWVHFPEYESANSRWRPPAEMRADAKRTRPLRLGSPG